MAKGSLKNGPSFLPFGKSGAVDLKIPSQNFTLRGLRIEIYSNKKNLFVTVISFYNKTVRLQPDIYVLGVEKQKLLCYNYFVLVYLQVFQILRTKTGDIPRTNACRTYALWSYICNKSAVG